jgi:2-amino-4-hydroxy-6-hydroxymethyldihydropteridine diphosphokinase
MSIFCYLGLGSNLRSPERQIRQAVQILRKLPRTAVKKVSTYEITEPLSGLAQPKYCNVIVQIKTTLPPHILLRYCQAIEIQKGRIRKKRWASRTLDIDVLLYGSKKINTPTLVIPHPGIHLRDFIYEPLQHLLGQQLLR